MRDDTCVRVQKRGEYDWEDVDPAVAIFELIAACEHEKDTGPAPILDPPLHTYVDTDALTTLVRSEGLVSISLRISSYEVHIHGNVVEVSTPEE